MLTLLVDGNNVMPALAIRRPEAIEQFLQKLEMAAVKKDWQVVVVFDGPARYLPRESGPLIVRYIQGKTADSVIEQMVFQMPDRSQTAVVTHDRAESDLVRSLGGSVWSAQRLSEELG